MNTRLCPSCQSPIPAAAPGGFCPACLLRGADELPPTGRAAPSVAEIAAAFPLLEVEDLIGQGGMGFVYKARQPAMERRVALKILAPDLSRDPAFEERFAREARVLGKLSHPNIVTVFEHGQRGGFFYLLMEYVDGVNLRQAMRAGRFTPQQALAVVPGICDALQAAHAQGVWHRDIKPENILMDSLGGIKIVDFGIARIVGDPARDFTLTVTGGALGSAAYMAPEQHERPHDVDHRADIYSLGVVIYEMLTGELPLGRFPAPSERAAVSARIDEIVFQTLAKEREMRQQSADEVKTDVAGADRSQSGASTPSPQSVLRRFSWMTTLWGVLLFGGTAAFSTGATKSGALPISLAAVAIGFIGLWMFRKSGPPDRPGNAPPNRAVSGFSILYVLLCASLAWSARDHRMEAKALLEQDLEAADITLRGSMARLTDMEQRFIQIFIVTGAVTHPGSYPLPEDSPVSVSQAITLAGGYSEPSIAKQVILMRTENGQRTTTIVETEKMLTGPTPESDPVLKPGDIIEVRNKAYAR